MSEMMQSNKNSNNIYKFDGNFNSNKKTSLFNFTLNKPVYTITPSKISSNTDEVTFYSSDKVNDEEYKKLQSKLEALLKEYNSLISSPEYLHGVGIDEANDIYNNEINYLKNEFTNFFRIKYINLTADELRSIQINLLQQLNSTNLTKEDKIILEAELAAVIYLIEADGCYIDKNFLSLLYKNMISVNDLKISYTGEIDDFTDYQNCVLATFNTHAYSSFYRDFAGKDKTIAEIYSYIKSVQVDDLYDEMLAAELDGDYDKVVRISEELAELGYTKVCESFIINGMGDFKIKEFVLDKYYASDAKFFDSLFDEEKYTEGFEMLVLEDAEGNYLVNFPCTNDKYPNEMLYDLVTILDSEANIVGEHITYKLEQQKASDAVKKYLQLASDEGVKVNVFGYSKGGSLSEGGYIDNYGHDSLGKLILYEPLHNNLTKYERNIVKEAHSNGNVEIYVSNGSVVSALDTDTYNDLMDITTFLSFDGLDANLKSMETVRLSDGIAAFGKLVKNVKALYSDGAHGAGNAVKYKSSAFLENGEAIKAKPCTIEELEESYGLDIDLLKTTGSKLIEILDDLDDYSEWVNIDLISRDVVIELLNGLK